MPDRFCEEDQKLIDQYIRNKMGKAARAIHVEGKERYEPTLEEENFQNLKHWALHSSDEEMKILRAFINKELHRRKERREHPLETLHR